MTGFISPASTSVRVGNNPPVWDFVIRRGVDPAPDGTSHVEQGLRHVGRCLVDGMDVLIAADINFSAQKLHVSRGRAATNLASLLGGVPTIADVPVGDDPDEVYLVVVYLDVWERLVTPDEVPGLVHSGLGVESSARLKREWVVRARAGSSIPTLTDRSDPDDPNRFIAGHNYYALATITHKRNVPITDEAIADQREQRLLMPPATLIEDLFGPVDYRRGQGRPIVNLREAINALLRGELPGSPEAPIGPEGHINLGRATFFDAAHGLITIWRSGQQRPSQIFAARLDLAKPEAGFRTIKQIPGPTSRHHHATLLDTGEVLLVYETLDTATPNIVMKRGSFDTLSDAPVIIVTDTAAGERYPFAVAVGKQVLILWHEDTDNTLQYKWYDPHNENNPFRQARKLSDSVNPTEFQRHGAHAAVDSTNSVWVAFQNRLPGGEPPGNEIRVIDVPPDPDELPGQPQPLSTGDSNVNPFVIVDNRDNVWVFWTSGGNNILYRRFLRATRAWEAEETQVPGIFGWEPTAVSDTEGGIWLSWVSREGNIRYARYSPVTQMWGEPRQITSSHRGEAEPFVLRGPDGSFWLFWHRAFSIDICRLFYRRIFPLI